MYSYCQICGKRINHRRGRPPRYCINCIKTYREKYFREYWKRNKDRYRERARTRIGTTDFKPHMSRDAEGNPDWEQEYKEIREEKKNLGLG